MTKEEINLMAEKSWEKVANEFQHRANGVNPHAFLLGFKDAMSKIEELNKSEAISFKEWEDENLEEKRWENYDGYDTWINPHTRVVLSTSQLYELFKSQSK